MEDPAGTQQCVLSPREPSRVLLVHQRHREQETEGPGRPKTQGETSEDEEWTSPLGLGSASWKSTVSLQGERPLSLGSQMGLRSSKSAGQSSPQ